MKPAFASALETSSLRTSEALRRAAVIFAQRLPDVWTITRWIVVPAAIGAALGALAIATLPRQVSYPAALLFVSTGFFFTAPTAMASMATIFDDLAGRPYSRVSWRSVARTIGRTPPAAALLAAAIVRPTRTYMRTSRRSGSSSMRNMLLFIAEYRGGAVPGEARIERMIAALRPGTFGSILSLQLFCTFFLPIVVGFAALGVSSFGRLGSPPLVGALAAADRPASVPSSSETSRGRRAATRRGRAQPTPVRRQREC